MDAFTINPSAVTRKFLKNISVFKLNNEVPGSLTKPVGHKIHPFIRGNCVAIPIFIPTNIRENKTLDSLARLK